MRPKQDIRMVGLHRSIYVRARFPSSPSFMIIGFTLSPFPLTCALYQYVAATWPRRHLRLTSAFAQMYT